MPRFLHCLSVTGSFWYTIDHNPVNRTGLAGKRGTMHPEDRLAVALVLTISASPGRRRFLAPSRGSVLDSTQAAVAKRR